MRPAASRCSWPMAPSRRASCCAITGEIDDRFSQRTLRADAGSVATSAPRRTGPDPRDHRRGRREPRGPAGRASAARSSAARRPSPRAWPSTSTTAAARPGSSSAPRPASTPPRGCRDDRRPRRRGRAARLDRDPAPMATACCRATPATSSVSRRLPSPTPSPPRRRLAVALVVAGADGITPIAEARAGAEGHAPPHPRRRHAPHRTRRRAHGRHPGRDRRDPAAPRRGRRPRSGSARASRSTASARR